MVTHNRIKLFAEDKNVRLIKSAFHYVQFRKYFKIEAICILPDHLHCIWTMTEDSNYSIRWQMIKTDFSRRHRCQNLEFKQKKLWQPRFWEHVIHDKYDMNRHIDYIHYNPVKHNLVESVRDWRYSSFLNFMNRAFMKRGGMKVNLNP